MVEEGYEFFARRQLVTIFSAPNYCGEFDNAGAMMSVDDTLMCSFQVLWPSWDTCCSIVGCSACLHPTRPSLQQQLPASTQAALPWHDGLRPKCSCMAACASGALA